MRIASGVTDQYIYFVAVDITDLKTRETGLTTFTVYRSRNGGAAAAMTTPTINETDATNMPGVYELLADEDMTIDAGDETQEMCFHITQASMAPVTRTIELYRPKITAGNTLGVASDGDISGNLDGTVATVTTLTGHTAQTGDNYVRLGAPAGASVSADIAAVEAQTDDIGVAGAGLTDLGGMSTGMKAEVNAECDTALTDYDGPTFAEIAPLLYSGPRGPGVYLDDGAANTNTVVGVDGIESNAVSTIAAATTIAGSLGIQRIYLVNDTLITLAQTYEGWEFVGIGLGNQITLGSQDVDNSCFKFMTVTGTQGGTGLIWIEDCSMTGLVSLECIAYRCYLTGTNTLRASGLILFDQCKSAVAGGSTPELTFAGAVTNLNFRHYSGGLQINSMATGDVMSYEADGQIIIDATCTDGTLVVRGNCDVTDNASGAVAITQSAAINQANINAEVDTGLADVNLDHLVGTATGIPAVVSGTYLDQIMDDGTATFDRTTDSLQAVRDRGDAAWTTGAGGSDRLLLVDTTILALTAQDDFTLAAGSADDNAYNNCTIVIEDATTSAQKATGIVLGYTGATKKVTLTYDPGIFVMANGDKVYILAENALKATDQNRQLDVSATGAAGIDWGNMENKTTVNDLSNTDINKCVTVTTLAGHTVQTGDSFARIGAAGASLTDLGGMSTGMKAEVNAEVDGALDTAIPELSQAAPSATPTLRTAAMLPYMAARNKLDIDASNKEIHNDAGTVITKKALSDDGTTYSEAEMVAGP